ncbi:AAA family ATPase [Ruminiclostridium cellobioparum]|uniref:AAA family ATPase n=1 Tax=Ruminiclostridium cellobioparum TaxID=29355 RepID=UPI0028AFBDC4|nr:hypothetical protein [Ruminiclostridium cellobioparum]
MVFYIIIKESLIDVEFIEQMTRDGHSVYAFFDFNSALDNLKKATNSIDLIIASETALPEENDRLSLLSKYLEDVRNISKAKILLQLNEEPTTRFEEFCRKINITIQNGDTIDLNIEESEESLEKDIETHDTKKIVLAVPDQYLDFFTNIPNISIAGKAHTRAELIELSKEHEPEIVLMTSDLPGDEEKGITYTVEQISLDTRIIMVLSKRLNDLIIGKLERDFGVEFIETFAVEEFERLINKNTLAVSDDSDKKRKSKKEKEIKFDVEKKSSGQSFIALAKTNAGNTVNSLIGIGKNVTKFAKDISSSKIITKISKGSTNINDTEMERIDPNKSISNEINVSDLKTESYINPQYRLIAVVSNGHTGKTTIAATLAYLASEKKNITSLVDLNLDSFDLYFHFNINEKYIRQELNHSGYNKYNMIFNALSEPDIDCLPDIAYRENKYLSVFSGDDGEENLYPEPENLLKLLDRLRSIYNITIVDTGEYNSLAHSVVSIADSVLFVHDLNPSNTRKNEQLLSQLTKVVNMKKFYLVINKAEEISEISVNELIKYYKTENGITFRDVFTIPMNSKACTNSSWDRTPIYKSTYDASHHMLDSFKKIYSSLFCENSTSKNRIWMK